MTTDSKLGRGQGLRLALWGAIAALFVAPLVAMQFTDQMAWTAYDFAVFGALLLSGGLAYELAAWKVKDRRYRIAIGLALAAALTLVWADGAVGVF
ncbi:MAG: hypothetical protein WA047_18360 [Phenylobacterium sp.]|uniref:hypothetical protein n=1 Tax=Phenylobacterium sp. TaxID=1871053 RepID=UPI003BB6B712